MSSHRKDRSPHQPAGSSGTAGTSGPDEASGPDETCGPDRQSEPALGSEPDGAPDRPRVAFLDRWPFRRKLDVLVFVPVLVIAGILFFVAYQQVEQARAAANTARLMQDSKQVARLINDLQTEHRQALLVSLRYEALPEGATTLPDTTAYHTAQVAVNRQVAAVRAEFGDRLPRAEERALRRIEGLDLLRLGVEQGPNSAETIDPAYNGAVADLINGLGINGPATSGGSASDDGESSLATLNGTGSDDGSTLAYGTLLDALLRANTAHASFETNVFAARTGDANALMQSISAIGAHEQYTYQADRFRRYATEQQGNRLGQIDQGVEQSVIDEHYAALRVAPDKLVIEDPQQRRAALEKSLRDDRLYQRQAQHRLHVTDALIQQLAADTQQASNDAWFRALGLSLAALLGFGAWVLFSVLAYRSVLRTVRAVTGAVQEVAEATGQELARVADDDAADTGPPRLAAVPVPVRDEIGELAEAFNRLQRTATALLERQVLSRRNIAEMFGNVGRRVSNLTARQLALIDAVERGETDPDVLERLYRIDHIAVRLQRNADSLMLLAGIRETGLDSGPARLSNVVRAALGQIEGYQRVTPRAEGDVTVSPDVVGDLTLMLAELLENAVTFSPASTRVELVLRPGAGPGRSSGPRTDGAIVEIVDHGLGMSSERLDEENARLVRRERLDLAPTKVLGLFVVGLLSRRWGIRVTLSRTPGGGVTARVVIPSVHLLPDPDSAPLSQPAGSGPGPVSPRPARVAPPEPGGSGLPRRVPARALRKDAAGPEAAPKTDRAADDAGRAGPARARDGGEGAPPAPPSRTPVPGATSPRPLRRRKRGATLSATTVSGVLPPSSQPADPAGWRPQDPEAIRAELEEFEAAVARAHHDSALLAPRPDAHRDGAPQSGAHPEPPGRRAPYPAGDGTSDDPYEGPHDHPQDDRYADPHRRDAAPAPPARRTPQAPAPRSSPSRPPSSPAPSSAPATRHTTRSTPPSSSEGEGQ